jgi:hypothetical protein
MSFDKVLKMIKPEVRDLGQDGSFAGNAIRHDAVKGRDAVGGDKEQLIS